MFFIYGSYATLLGSGWAKSGLWKKSNMSPRSVIVYEILFESSQFHDELTEHPPARILNELKFYPFPGNTLLRPLIRLNEEFGYERKYAAFTTQSRSWYGIV